MMPCDTYMKKGESHFTDNLAMFVIRDGHHTILFIKGDIKEVI